jgi:EmrB/QacA subfamily drug resistance transporter
MNHKNSWKRNLFNRLATHENRWYALLVMALGLAIVIIDNTVLNVSIPYILRDLNASFSSIQWIISGYALTIATILITIGRAGDIFGRKRLFIVGMIIFAIGSFIGSTAKVPATLIIGRAIIQAIGAAMTLTSALALLASEFQGRERAIAFGIWGSVAGASATLGPLLGGYLTTYSSWRWSLRINLVVSLAALIGSVFIIESKGKEGKGFDWWGTLLSGLGLFSLIFGFIEAPYYGWWAQKNIFQLFGLQWPFSFSVIPLFFASGTLLLTLFAMREWRLETRKGNPLFLLSTFKSRGFSVGLSILALLSFALFGLFFVLPIYLEDVLGYNAFQTGLILMWSSTSIFVLGTLSGFIASRINIKWLITAGLIILSGGAFFLRYSITSQGNVIGLSIALALFGIGFGMGSAQLNNIVLSSAPTEIAGEASAASITMRQIGSAGGIAIIGAFLASSLSARMVDSITSDSNIPSSLKPNILSQLQNIDIESGQINFMQALPTSEAEYIRNDVEGAVAGAAGASLSITLSLTSLAALISFFLPSFRYAEA